LVRTREPCADVKGLEFDGFERRHLAGRLKNDELRRRSGSGSAAERAILEMSVRSGMLVMAMMGRHGKGAWHRRCRRTQFQQKRRPAGRHETDGHVCPQQQHRQQNAGQYVVSPTVECRWFHDCEPTMPDRIPPHQWGKYEVRPEHAAGSVALHLRVATNTGSAPALARCRGRGPPPRTTRRNPAASSCLRCRRSIYAASLDTPDRCPER
jgi:hypothetical protein